MYICFMKKPNNFILNLIEIFFMINLIKKCDFISLITYILAVIIIGEMKKIKNLENVTK